MNHHAKDQETETFNVQLAPVTDLLASRSEVAAQAIRHKINLWGVNATVSVLGSSQWVGSLSRGDIDLLIIDRSQDLSELCERLREEAEVAQPENWTESFVSFQCRGLSSELSTTSVGLQVFRGRSREAREITHQQSALATPQLRDRYDIAKRLGAPLGVDGYWVVKDVFWKTWERVGPRWALPQKPVVKLLYQAEWEALLSREVTGGSQLDQRDGFIHLSEPEQVAETARLHFDQSVPIWLLGLDAAELGESLVYEASRGGALFPHLYDSLKLSAVCFAHPWRAHSTRYQLPER